MYLVFEKWKFSRATAPDTPTPSHSAGHSSLSGRVRSETVAGRRLSPETERTAKRASASKETISTAYLYFTIFVTFLTSRAVFVSLYIKKHRISTLFSKSPLNT